MTAKRLLSATFLVALLFSTGCRHFCEKHYPCGQQACSPCVPCCPAPGPAVSPYPPPPVPQGANFSTPRCGTCVCP